MDTGVVTREVGRRFVLWTPGNNQVDFSTFKCLEN